MRIALLKVLAEHSCQLVGRRIVERRALPVGAGHKNGVRHTMARHRNIDVENLVMDEIGLLDGPIKCTCYKGARIGKLDAMAMVKVSAYPAGVDQVHARVAAAQALAKHFGIDHRIERHERLAKKRRERGLRSGDTVPGVLEVKPVTK